MRDEAALRLSVSIARLVVEGREWVSPLCEGVRTLVGVDNIGALQWRPAGSTAVPVRVLVDCSPSPRTSAEIALARVSAMHDPGYGPRGLRADRPCLRLSDLVRLPPFWDTEVFNLIHRRAGRYPCAVNFGCSDRGGVFLSLHRGDHDFSDREVEVLANLHEPLASALRFRSALDAAVGRLGREAAEVNDGQLSRREAEVLALVAAGWTNVRIARRLGITERTVRKHLDAARQKTHTANRAEAAFWWAQHHSIPGRFS